MQSTSDIEAKGFSPVRRARLGIGLSIVGTLLVMFPFGEMLAYFGLVLIAAGMVISTTFERESHTWWYFMLIGTVMALLSPLIVMGSESLGGWAGIAGGTAILIGSVLAFPVGDKAP